MEAFILLSVRGDHTKSAYKTITRVSGVKSVYAVTGMYDIIAHVESDDMDTLGDLISMVRTVDGVNQTVTCVALHV